MKFVHLIVIALCVIQLAACTTNPPVRVVNGETYCMLPDEKRFTGTYYDYYEVGLDCARGQLYEDAEKNILIALNRKDTEKSMLRTQGGHFIDYFPNRELGILKYFQGKEEEALKYLNKSIKFESSPRAVFYLNCVRRAITQKQAKDKRPPKINVHFPDSISIGKKLVTSDYQLAVLGHVTDNTYVQSISINNKSVNIETFAPDIDINEIISMTAGENVIYLTATDVSGNVSTITQTVFLDIFGPIISIASDENDIAKTGILKGMVRDESGIQKLMIIVNDKAYPQTVQADSIIVTLNYKLPNEASIQSIRIEAQDRVGNSSSIDLLDNPKQVLSKPVWLASNGFIAGLFSSEQTTPEIIIENYEKLKTLISNEISVKIKISHIKNIQSVRIYLNEIKIPVDDNDSYLFNARKLVYEPRLQFRDGDNKLEVKVKTVDRKDDTIKIFLFEVKRFIRNQWKMKVALFPNKHSQYQNEIKDTFQSYLQERFNFDLTISSEEEFQKKRGCNKGYFECDGNQAALWSVEWRTYRVIDERKTVEIFKKDNYQEYIKEKERNPEISLTDSIPLKNIQALLFVKDQNGKILFKVPWSYETTEVNELLIQDDICKILSNMLMDKIPIVEYDINELLQSTHSLISRTISINTNIKEGMRVIVFNPIYDNTVNDRDGIAEAVIDYVENTNLRAKLCNPLMMSRINKKHHVILR